MFEHFTGLYKLSKTLRFELKPVGETLANIKASGVLERDLERAEHYARVKEVLDGEHRALLERALGGVSGVDWQELAEAYRRYRASDKSAEARNAIDAATALCRKALVDAFKADEMFDALTEATPSKFLKVLIKAAVARGEKPEQAVALFSSFACYFTGFQENRANIYSTEKQVTAAANRAVNENYPRFLECCDAVAYLREKYPDVLADSERELSSLLKGRPLQDICKPGAYAEFLPQTGITKFNAIIGGFTLSTGVKIRGLNEFINLYRQQHESAKGDRKLARLPLLYKQILSDRETVSFVAEAFSCDHDVLAAIRAFGETLAKEQTLEHLRRLLTTLESRVDVHVAREHLSDVSKWLCGNWSTLREAMQGLAETLFGGIKAAGKREKEIERWLKRDEYALAEVTAALQGGLELEDGTRVTDIADCWKGKQASAFFAAVPAQFAAVQRVLESELASGLAERQSDVAAIKDYLDAVQAVLHFVKPLRVSAELDRDMDFYGEYDDLYERLERIVPLYNRVRNYLTKKPSEARKMKLMFDVPTLAAGWDLNKEEQNKSILLEKGGQYYLGIVNPRAKNKSALSASAPDSGEGVYRKMVYKLLPGPNKMLPKVFFSAKGREIYHPSQELLEQYAMGAYKKGKNFSLAFCHELIDFFKQAIAARTEWKAFDFKFSPTSSYAGIDEFYREVSDQGYKVSFVDVSEASVDVAVKSGALFLFRLHNKDFASGSTGRPNLHTLYWRLLFDPANLKSVVFKLNGEAELFYRQASISKPFVHAVGEKMVNRRDLDGRPIEDAVFGELFAFVNGRKSRAELSDKARLLLDEGKVVVKDVRHPIVKDARYAEDKFFFHVPITLNARAADKPIKFNDRVNAFVRNTKGVNVIGIDRGERHLLYVTVVNPKGEILEQRSFNVLAHETFDGRSVDVDYHAKLDQREKARDEARRSWNTIGQIKDLKAGYLSVVVHEIARLVVKYNAVIALEDLNFGFKRGRFAIEKQVYQKFEQALIDKFNYLVFKDADPLTPGGALNAFQLTDKFVSFERLGKQTGIIYYVPAAYTSKIDPTTGFTNLFDLKKCTNAENIKSFFGLFETIRYEEAERAFAFAFDYERFKTRLKGRKTAWTVYSAERRLVFDAKTKHEKEIFPTQIILDTLAARGVVPNDGFDLKAFLLGLSPTRENAALVRDVFYAFERTLQMRNSSSATGDDYIQSPVKGRDGRFFDSRHCGGELPCDADANGAYHIALKGLWIVTQALQGEKPDLKLDHETWFAYAQSRH